jgi:hypothetical protein
MDQVMKGQKSDPQVFVSYGHNDNLSPSDRAGEQARGFVTWLVSNLKYELTNKGLGELWFDNHRLRTGDNIDAEISQELRKSDILLAVVSSNFVQSQYCYEEIELFAREVASDANARKRFIRVDKGEVKEDQLPEHLRGIYSIQFYLKEPDGSAPAKEFFWRGKAAVKRAIWEPAIMKLGADIHARLVELNPDAHKQTRGQGMRKEPPIGTSAPANPVRTVYVAKPAGELRDEYKTLVREMQGRGIRVVPDLELNIPEEATAAVAFVRSALDQADASVHVVGSRRGSQDGVEQGIVPLQLAEARAKADLDKKFQRLIWAPRIVPGSEDSAPARDPIAVLAQFDSSVATDEIEGDTAARFKDFLLDRLLKRGGGASPAIGKASIFVAAAAADKLCAIQAGNLVRGFGSKPKTNLFAVGYKGVEDCDHVIICWGTASELDVYQALEAARRSLRASRPNGKLCLLIYPPQSDAKQFAIDVDSYGGADLVVEVTESMTPDDLASLLGISGT